MNRRKIPLAIISDLHLGTFGCQAGNLIQYLRSIHPEVLVLNGDIIDMWQFNKHYFPGKHMQVLKEIVSFISEGVKVVYITGNHDDRLRTYSDLNIGNFTLTDKLVLNIDGKRAWIFHGDIFDATTRGSAKALAKLGGVGYDILILMNQCINWFLQLLGKEKMSFSKKVKGAVKQAVKWIGDFEKTAADLAIDNGYDYVICGHIHQPVQREISNEKGSVVYLNSGDWVEHCTALEYYDGGWHLYTHKSQSGYKSNKKEYKKIPDVLSTAISMLIQPA